MTILFAQSRAGNGVTIQTHLKNHGYQVITSKNNVEAMIQVFQHQPDVIITDLNYSSLTLSLISQLKQNGSKKIPILILSIAGQETLVEEALELGADDYLDHADREEKLKELSLRINLLTRSRVRAMA